MQKWLLRSSIESCNNSDSLQRFSHRANLGFHPFDPEIKRGKAVTMNRFRSLCSVLSIGACMSLGMSGCPTTPEFGDGPIAPDISAPLGEPIPTATETQLATFARGKDVLKHRFTLADGLGPAFNVTFCGACHEKPVGGGSAGLYRNFFLAGKTTGDGAFLPSQSAGMAGGVLRVFNYGEDFPARPPIPDDTTIFAQRNAIPMFGVGLIAEITDDEILSRADENDANGDGISGRANFEAGFVGRFGRKSQTASIEGFIRGPLFNHLGVTTQALTDEQRMALPVDSSSRESSLSRAALADPKLQNRFQVAVNDSANFDNDAAPDPEMSRDDLFDLISFSMLLAAPQFEDPTEQSERGRQLMHTANCTGCHVPRVNGPRGPLPIYSDLLIHDMGDDLADGIVQGSATGKEFRTQPLWGISAVGPYLHDGRAGTIEDAILAHGGEAKSARDAFAAFSAEEKADLIEFLLTLGGRSQLSEGLLPPMAEVPGTGEYGGPFRDLTSSEMEQSVRGRAVYDRDFIPETGVGGLKGADGGGRFNGDSCRACHQDPVIGGAGPRDVNVMRHGVVNDSDVFTASTDSPNTILHKEIRVGHRLPKANGDVNVFEHRQTPHNFGLGLIDSIPEATILSHEDPDDMDHDGISGRAHVLSDSRIGRFGWKAQVPSVAEFVGDAMAAELGITLPESADLSFSITSDDDETADPELPLSEVQDITFFLKTLAGPPRQLPTSDAEMALVTDGEALFTTVGCAKCHIPSMTGSLGEVPLFSDLLLHEILPGTSHGIADGDAGQREFRTSPLWGLSKTAPYFHDGRADTIEQAIEMHAGEAETIRDAFEALSNTSKKKLITFLETL